MAGSKFQDMDAYIQSFPPDVQPLLQDVREMIHRAAPEADETISYDMPTFNVNGNYLVYFAGWKKHIALYPVTPTMLEELGEEAVGYKGTKGSIHFPINQPMPLDLIKKIVGLRLNALSAAGKL